MELSETLAMDCVPSSLFLCFCVLNLFLFLANNLPFVAHLYCQRVFLTPRHQLVCSTSFRGVSAVPLVVLDETVPLTLLAEAANLVVLVEVVTHVHVTERSQGE